MVLSQHTGHSTGNIRADSHDYSHPTLALARSRAGLSGPEYSVARQLNQINGTVYMYYDIFRVFYSHTMDSLMLYLLRHPG